MADPRYSTDRSNAIACGPLARRVKFSNVPAYMVSLALCPPLFALMGIETNRPEKNCAIFSAYYLKRFADDRSDAIPKKRGPKTDVLEALLKRVDGLEKRLQDEKRPTEDSSTAKTHDDFTPDGSTIRRDAITSHRDSITSGDAVVRFSESSSDRRSSTTIPTAYEGVEGSSTRFRQPYAPSNAVTLPDAMLEAFFARIHGKPFVILDEHATRQKHRLGQLTPTLAMAIYALTVRCVEQIGVIITLVHTDHGSIDTSIRQVARKVRCVAASTMRCRQGRLSIWTIRPLKVSRRFFYCLWPSLPMDEERRHT